MNSSSDSMCTEIESEGCAILAASPPPSASASRGSGRTPLPLPINRVGSGAAVTPNPFADSSVMIMAGSQATVSEIRRQLREWGYHNFQWSEHGASALEHPHRERPDLLILDTVIAGSNSLELLEAIRADWREEHLPVLLLVSHSATATRRRALELGVTEFLNKPVDSTELGLRVRNVLERAHERSRLLRIEHEIEQRLTERTADLIASRKEALRCLARVGEYRDHGTGRHVLRVSLYAGIIARQLGLSECQISLMEDAALLHDIGKIGISDYLLLKPGKLTLPEFSVMKQHCEFGRDILQPSQLDSQEPKRTLESVRSLCDAPSIMELAAVVAMTHHEWWNGQGYPNGLAGESIPLEGRVTAIADVYDALSSHRPYKAAFPQKRCIAMMQEKRGTQFDPTAIDAFFAAREQILEVQERLADGA